MNVPGDLTADEKALLAREKLDTVAGAFAYAGGQRLDKPGLGNRERFRLTLTDAAGRQVVWYLKRYSSVGLLAQGQADPAMPRGRVRSPYGPGGVGLQAQAKRLWRRLAFRATGPVKAEVEGIRLVRQAGIPTMRLIAAGIQRDCLGHLRSYIIVSAVAGEKLETCFEDFLARHATEAAALEQFDSALAELAGKLHSAGLCHRDLYAAHIFLEETPAGVRLYLIDLARVFRPCCRQFRWRVKDLAALRYSLPQAWVQRHWESFLGKYVSAAGGGGGLDARLWRRYNAAVEHKVRRLRRRGRRKGAVTKDAKGGQAAQ